MKSVVLIFQVVVSVLLILAILAQARGTGLSAVFGGEGGVFHKRRGAERVLSTSTVVLAVLFVASSLVYIFVS